MTPRHPVPLPAHRQRVAGLVRASTLLALFTLGSGCTTKSEQAPPAPTTSSATARPALEAPSTLDAPLRASFAAMANASSFGGLAIGAGGTPSTATEGFRALLASPDAAAAFTLAADGGSPAGQLYGLSGLALVDPAAFARKLGAFRTREDAVDLWMSGCTGGDLTKMRDVVAAPDGAQMAGPDDTAEAWRARNPGKPFHADVAGGFLPRLLAGKAWPRGTGTR